LFCLSHYHHPALSKIYPLSLHDALPISADLIRTGRWEGELIHTRRDGTKVVSASRWSLQRDGQGRPAATLETNNDITERNGPRKDRKSTRLNSSHVAISYAVFCLKKKKK